MCPYITQRINEGRKWKAVLATISFIFGLLMVICVFMALKEKEFAAAVFAVLFAALFAALTIWLALSYFNRSLERSIARDIGVTLEGVSGDRISYDEFLKITHSHDTVSHAEKLLKKGYLRNIVLDSDTQTIILTDRQSSGHKETARGAHKN